MRHRERFDMTKILIAYGTTDGHTARIEAVRRGLPGTTGSQGHFEDQEPGSGSVGAAQADCLYRWRVLPVRRWWIVATSVGAAVAWSLGMLPSTFDLRWTAATVVGAGVGGLLLLTSLPLAQHFVLRDHVRRPARWIPINIAAWLLGIAWTLAPSPVVDQSTPAGALILIYGIAGLGMAATVAVVTGMGMIRLLQTPIELDDRSQADQARRVSGSVDAHAE
jgi:hypothetical protein